MRPPGFRSGDPDRDEAPAVDRRPQTPVYERDPARAWSVSPVSSRGRKTVGDRLLELMSDRMLHAVSEMESILPDGEWARAL